MSTPTAEQFFREWVADLESGKLPQVQGALAKSVSPGTETPIGFCCLGVASEVAYRHGMVNRVTIVARDERSRPIRRHLYDGGGAMLPPAVQELLSVGASVRVRVPAKYRLAGEYHELANLNDVNGLSFAQIAAIIAWNFLDEKRRGTQDGSA